MPQTIDKRDAAKVREIDAGIKNKFRWDWLDRKVRITSVDGEHEAVSVTIGHFIQKLDVAGKALCTVCDDVVNYRSRGLKALESHAVTAKHRKQAFLLKSKSSLSSAFESKPSPLAPSTLLQDLQDVHEFSIARSADIRSIEGKVKNKFRWSWLKEKDANGDFLSDYVRKVDRPGYALCTWCNDLLKYESSGKKGLRCHSKCKKHIEARTLKRTNQTLPAVFHNVNAMEKGATSSTSTMPSENVHSAASCSASQMTPTKPVISFLDRKSYQEAALLSFMAEHSLPLSISPHLIKFAQEFSRDTRVTNAIQTVKMI
ncbi:uncharacterized protein LOC132873191 isoform X2 [Neoarius graeffei]|uniref:uncharacterized protein LOC132873191 isoform X2 n=1 Tax=Neoarius graeffei TaxID=443677 RepID=UPI00298C4668|nr:uncharacterized protein LOC132873191 isoform X2 [Neoarius graeffei]